MKGGPHILLSSDSGTGKSTFGATIIQERNPRPVLIQAFDARDKLRAYYKRATRVESSDSKFGPRELLYRDDKLVAVLERWHERGGRGSRGVTMKGGNQVQTIRFDTQGRVFEQYLERMRHFDEEIEQYYAYIHDSSTFCELAVRAYLTGIMHVKDNQMIWGQATDELERFYSFLFPDLPITTILISHAGNELMKDGNERIATGRRNVRLPGRLRDDLYASFGEIYRCYINFSKRDGTTEYLVQTQGDKQWRCQSQIGVPNPMEPHWKHVYRAMEKVGAAVE